MFLMKRGNKVTGMLLVLPLIQGMAGELVNVLREAGQIVPPDLIKFGTHVKKKV